MTKIKTKMLLVIVLIFGVIFSTMVFAVTQRLTPDQAKKIAEKQVPAGSTHIKTENDENEYEIKFYNEVKSEKYEIDVNKITQKITSYKTQKTIHDGSKSVLISEEQVKKIVLNEIPKAKILSIKLDTDDSYKKYEVSFKSDTYYGDMEVNPESGAILEREFKIGQNQNIVNTTNSVNDKNTTFISYEKVKEIALLKVPKGIVTDIDIDRMNDTYVYDIEIFKDNYEYELIINATTGEQISLLSHEDSWENDKFNLDWDYEEYFDDDITYSNGSNSTKDVIGVEKAKQIALSKVPGAKITKLELDSDDGMVCYEGEMYKDGWEYEFKIDAYTGNTLEWEKDFDD